VDIVYRNQRLLDSYRAAIRRLRPEDYAGRQAIRRDLGEMLKELRCDVLDRLARESFHRCSDTPKSVQRLRNSTG
jgi:hypothetical protein